MQASKKTICDLIFCSIWDILRERQEGGRGMTVQSKQQIAYILSTHAIEKMVPSKEAIRLCEKMADGAMDADTAVSTILERYGLVKVGTDG